MSSGLNRAMSVTITHTVQTYEPQYALGKIGLFITDNVA